MTVGSATARRCGAALASLLVTALVGGCAGSQAAVGRAEPAPGATPPTSAAGPGRTPRPSAVALSPLTGLPAPSPDTATRPAVGVAVATGNGLPAPVGLERADLQYVTFPVPGRQRTVAVFQSQDADRVGPVDDTRPVDNKIMVVLGGVLEHGGGTAGFVSRTDNADVPQWSAVVHPSDFARDAAGNLFGSTAVARAEPGTKPAREGLVAFRTPEAAGAPPGPVGVGVSGQPGLTLSYDPAAGTWNGSMGLLPVHATNVIVQQVAYARLDLPHTQATEGDPTVLGTGAALVLSGSRLVDATWNRVSRTTLNSYVGTDGTPVRLAPGSTVVLLVPTGTPVTR